MSERLDEAIESADRTWWLSGALLALQQLALTKRGFTANELVDTVGEPDDPHYLGIAFALAQKKGLIEQVGARIGRKGPVRVWWGT